MTRFPAIRPNQTRRNFGFDNDPLRLSVDFQETLWKVRLFVEVDQVMKIWIQKALHDVRKVGHELHAHIYARVLGKMRLGRLGYRLIMSK